MKSAHPKFRNLIKAIYFFSSVCVPGLVFAQPVSQAPVTSPCLATYGQFPTSFEGQKCWLEYSLGKSIYVYGDKFNEDSGRYRPIQIPAAVIAEYLNYNKGLSNYYVPKEYTPWGGNWYSCAKGGISRRFHSTVQDHPVSTKLKWSDVKKMNSEEINKLSPAEKMDIFLFDTTFSITKFELTHRGPERKNTNDDGFCGFCNGARIAGIITPEPKHSVTVWNSEPYPGGKQITFTIGDIKALLSASYMHPAFTFSFGRPIDSADANDPNPAIIDMMLRLYMGKYNVPFVIDDAYGPEIFNETVMGYQRKSGAARNLTAAEKQSYKSASKAVKVDLVLYLQDELSFKRSETETVSIMSDSTRALKEAEPAAVNKTWVHRKSYKYLLFIDDNGTIQNGKWLGHEPIDFIWAAHGNPNEDNNIIGNDVPGIPSTDRNTHLKWIGGVNYIRRISIDK
jgi:hypothetical protein